MERQIALCVSVVVAKAVYNRFEKDGENHLFFRFIKRKTTE